MMNESAWFALLLELTVKSTAVLAVAWVLALLLRRRSAAARHLIWTAAAAALLALPLLTAALPRVHLPGAFLQKVEIAFQATAAAGPAQAAPSRSIEAQQSVTAQPPSWRPDWRLGLMLLWLAGFAAALVQMAIAFAGMWRVRRASRPSPDQELPAQLARSLGIRHAVDVLQVPGEIMPMAFGLLRPAVFLPGNCNEWTVERRRIVLLHELAHLRRGDVATHLLARLALVLNWWNPLAWTAWREFLKERERATDDLVLHSGARASEYASHLLEVARDLQSRPALGWAAVAMARRSQLEGRLIAILDAGVRRKISGRASALAAAVLAVFAIAPLAAVRAQQPASPALPQDIENTIRAAAAQNNHEMLEQPAAAFEKLGQYDAARRLLDAAAAVRAQTSGTNSLEYGQGLLKLGELERKRNRRGEAAAFYQKALEVLGDKPEGAPALLFLGVNAVLDNNFAQALEYLQRAQTLDPSQAGVARMWMAVALDRQHNPDAAAEMYRSALSVQTQDTAAGATTMELYARFLREQGSGDEAQAIAGQAASIRKALGASARQQPRAASVLRIGAPGVVAPKLLSKLEPAYTDEARAAKLAGTVIVSVEIGPDGFAHNPVIVQGLGLGLDENAIASINQWTFQPATQDGQPVTVQATIEVNFRLM